MVYGFVLHWINTDPCAGAKLNEEWFSMIAEKAHG
jgi:hypothetical protein